MNISASGLSIWLWGCFSIGVALLVWNSIHVVTSLRAVANKKARDIEVDKTHGLTG